MTQTDWIGFTGVTLLLIAYLFNLGNKLKKESLTYLLLNFIGAGLACLASALLNYLPFIILEACWTIVSAIGIFHYFNRRLNNKI